MTQIIIHFNVIYTRRCDFYALYIFYKYVIYINRMYKYILLVAIFIILGFTLYYSYTDKESFEDAAPEEVVDINNVNVITPPEELIAKPPPNISIEDAQTKMDTMAPIIAANPAIKGVFNSDTGIDLSQIDFDKAKEQAKEVSIPTGIDKRPATDIDRQCDTYLIQLDSIKANIKAYKKSQSWAQVRDFNETLTELKTHMSEIGC